MKEDMLCGHMRFKWQGAFQHMEESESDFVTNYTLSDLKMQAVK